MHYILYENVSAGVRVLDISAHVFILNFPTKACIYFKCYFNAKNPEQLLKTTQGGEIYRNHADTEITRH